MTYFVLPKITLLNKTSLEGNSCHSMLISLARGFAAVEVAAAHLRALAFPGYKSIANPSLLFQGLVFFTGFAHQAVVLFFLLSGWLVGGSLLNRAQEPNAIKNYAIDRMTRLWIVLIPAFLLTLLFGILENKVSFEGIIHSDANEYSALVFIGNMFGLQTMYFPNYGRNLSLWSLANETWYYMLFPLLLILANGRSCFTMIVSGVMIIVIAFFISYPILLFFSLWLLGVAFSRVRIDASGFFQAFLFLLFCLIAIYFRLKGSNDDLTPDSFLQDFLFSVSFLLFLCSMQYKINLQSFFIKPVDAIGKYFSGFSFSLYVIHVPLIVLILYYFNLIFGISILSYEEPWHLLLYFAILTVIIFTAYLFYLLFESKTYKVRNRIKHYLAKPDMKEKAIT